MVSTVPALTANPGGLVLAVGATESVAVIANVRAGRVVLPLTWSIRDTTLAAVVAVTHHARGADTALVRGLRAGQTVLTAGTGRQSVTLTVMVR